MISVNQRTERYIRQMTEDSEALKINAFRLTNGTTIIDCGVEVDGSYEAGILFAEASMAGMGRVQFIHKAFANDSTGPFWLPAVCVSVSQPLIACLNCQMASWPIRIDDFFAMGSGPACAIYNEREYPGLPQYKEVSETAVLLLEGASLPDERVAALVAEKCKVTPDRLTLVAAPAASLVGCVQIAARVVEVGMHKLLMLGFDVNKVVAAIGYSPIATLANDEQEAMGRSNDAILYGSQLFFTVRADDSELEQMLPKVPSMSSRDYGALFVDLLHRYGGDFYQMDPMLFSPAEVVFNNLTSGRVFTAGGINHALLHTSLFPTS